MLMNKRIAFLPLICVMLLAVFVPSCFANEPSLQGTLVDPRDGHNYKTVKIGEQTWMAENLNYEMENTYCYENLDSNCVKYGRLYALSSAKEACPAGWRVPTQVEWSVLINFAGGPLLAGEKLKSKEGWLNGGNGSDELNFSAYPAGIKLDENFNSGSENGAYSGMRRNTAFWSTGTEKFWRAGVDNYGLYLYYYNDRASLVREPLKYEGHSKDRLSIRCIKDDSPKSSSSTARMNSSSAFSVFMNPIIPIIRSARDTLGDSLLIDFRDGQAYKVVTIGEQTWMAENLNYETENSTCYRRQAMNCFKYGRVYTRSDALKACPAGYHLPTMAEWKSLITTVGGPEAAKTLMSKKWDALLNIDDSTDKYGFSVIVPYLNLEVYFWSASEKNDSNTYHMTFRCEIHETSYMKTNFCFKRRACFEKDEYVDLDQHVNFFPVRCVKGEISNVVDPLDIEDSTKLDAFICRDADR